MSEKMGDKRNNPATPEGVATSGPRITELLGKMKREPVYAELIARFEQSHELERRVPEASERYSETTWTWLMSDCRWFESDREFLKEKLIGDVLVDLGGGSGRLIREVAKAYDASMGINVDRYAYDHKYPADPLKNIGQSVLKPIPEVATFSADILDFVSRLPDDSVNYMANGIDSYIIGLRGEYNAALAREIVRTLKPGGIIFGNSFEGIWTEFTGQVSGFEVTDEYKEAGIRHHSSQAQNRYGIGPAIFEKEDVKGRTNTR